MAAVLIAGILDWIVPAVIGTIFLLRIINEVVTKMREEAAKRPAQGGQRAAGPPRPPRRANQGPDPGKEVEEFLRRVAEMGREEPRERPGIPVEVLESPRRPPRPAPSAQKPPRAKQPKQPKPPKPAERLGERHLQSEVAARHVSSRVERSDERVEQQLQQHLDHLQSNIPGAIGAAPPTGGLAASRVAAAARGANLAALLASADNVRQAIVLNEILRRPEERWE